MDIIVKGRHTDVPDRFRKRATEKLAKIEKLDQKAIRVDVEVTVEHNPRQAQRKERVELTISSRGPVVRAEASAEDRYIALDMAFARLESRLRKACDRRKSRHGGHAAARADAAVQPPLPEPRGGEAADAAGPPAPAGDRVPADDTAPAGDGAPVAGGTAAPDGAAARDGVPAGDTDLVPVKVQGDGPLVVREKFHGASPMTIDQALFEMEMVGHDFFLYRDIACGKPSVVYRRRGYQYGVIRLIDELTEVAASDGRPAQDRPADRVPSLALRPGVGKSDHTVPRA